MSHNSISKDLPQELKDKLHLSESQLAGIDNIYLEFMRKHHFDWGQKQSLDVLKFNAFKKIMQTLDSQQREVYRKERRNAKIKREEKRVLREERNRKAQRAALQKRYASLNLSEEQFVLFESTIQSIHDSVYLKNKYSRHNEEYVLKALDKLDKILDVKQKTEFRLIHFKEMSNIRDQEIQNIQLDFRELNISEEQAVMIMDFQNELKGLQEKDIYLNEFEKINKEHAFLKTILDPLQFKKQVTRAFKKTENRIEEIEKSESKADEKFLDTKKYEKFLVDNYLKEACLLRQKIETLKTPNDEILINQLKEAYQKKLEHKLDKCLVSHKRHYLDHAPKVLANKRLNLSLNLVFPKSSILANQSAETYSNLSESLKSISKEVQEFYSRFNPKLSQYFLEKFEKSNANYASLMSFGDHRVENGVIINFTSLILLECEVQANLKNMELFYSQNRD